MNLLDAQKKDLVSRDRQILWHPYTQEKLAPSPIALESAEGIWLKTTDGRRILDGISSWWVNIHGHAHPILNQALSAQAAKLEHAMFGGFTHAPAVELAEKLLEVLPKNLSRVFYSDNGSTAVEVALKMAFQFWQNRGETRKTFVAFSHAYHGDTFGAMAASDDSSFTAPFKSLLFNVLRADSPYSFHCGKCRAECDLQCANSLEKILEKHSKEVAAVIIEPMLQGAGGMIVWTAEFLRKVAELCRKHNVLLIADEVLTGFGRTGKMFAVEHGAIQPDIICLSKALTAGYLPLGVTAATEEIYQAFYSDDRAKTFFHGHSFTANPLACAVGAASLDLFHETKCLERVAFIEQRFKEFMPRLAAIPCVGETRIIGGVLACEIQTDDGGYLAEIGRKLATEFLSRDILLRPLGNVLYFMPPYVITEAEIEFVLQNISEVLSKIAPSVSGDVPTDQYPEVL